MSSQSCTLFAIWNIKDLFPSRADHPLHDLEHQRFLSIEIFDVLCVISCVLVHVFPTVHNWKIGIFLQVFYKGLLFTTRWVRTVVSMLTCTFTYIYLSYIGIFSVGGCQHVIGFCHYSTNFSSVLRPT